MRAGIIAGLVTVAVVLGVLALLFAEGAPTAPSVDLYTPINPSVAQSLLVQFIFGYYSIAAPNAIWDLGQHITYSATEQTSLGLTTVVAVNALSAPVIVSQSGQFYTMRSTVNVVTVAACAGAACAGVTENITLTAQANVVTPYVAWFSPTTVAVFSSTQATGCTQGQRCAPQSITPNVTDSPVATMTALDSFLQELFIPLTALVAVGAFAVILLGGKHPIFMGTAVVATILVLVEFIIW